MIRYTTLHWTAHSPGFKSLMLGRIELAQISGGNATSDWFWTLRFCDEGERSSFSAPTEDEARDIAEAHARRVLIG